jgi:heterodisulfide reductase subunit C
MTLQHPPRKPEMMVEPSKVIDMDDLDQGLVRELSEKTEESSCLLACIQCGTCTSSCPVTYIDARFNPRRIVRMAIFGMREELLAGGLIWLCSTCNTCIERCPQDALKGFVSALRNIAAKDGRLHPTFRKILEVVGLHGRIYEVDEFLNLERSELGLPEIHEETQDIRRIFALTEVNKLLEGGGDV